MKVSRTEAIVLHTYPSRERDKLVVFLTPEGGKKKGWAYGARGIRSRFGAALEPLSKVRIGYLEKENEEVVRIESVDLVRSLFPAQQQLPRSVAATYIAETIDTFVLADDPSELLYRLLDRCCEALLGGLPVLDIVAYAEVWTLKLAGILPSIKSCFDCHQPLVLPLVFDSVRNGFVCEPCRGGDSMLVPNDVSLALRDLLRDPVELFAAGGIPAQVLLDIRSLARALRRSFLGYELKSHELLGTVLMS